MTLCREDPELWFTPGATAKAKAICGRCPVRAGCLAHALDHKIAHGVWGGLTPTERDRLTHPRRARREPSLVQPPSQAPRSRRRQQRHPS